MTPATAGSHRAEMRSLPPILTVDGNDYLLMVAQLAGIAARELRPPLIDLPGQRSAVVNAEVILTRLAAGSPK